MDVLCIILCTSCCFTGIVAGVWPCGIITFLGEIYGSESKTQVYGLLHAFLHTNVDTTSDMRKNNSCTITQRWNCLRYQYTCICITTGFVCYDDGCHLKKYASHSDRRQLTPTAKRLAELNIVVDKLHFQGHTDRWCFEHCNPYKFDELKEVGMIKLNSFHFYFV